MDWFLLSLMTAAVWGVVPFFEKQGVSAVGCGFAAVAIRSVGAAIGLFLPLLVPSARVAIATAPIKGIAFLIIAGFIGSVVGQITYLNAIKIGEVSKVTPVAAAWPVMTLFVALCLLGEPISAKKIVAVVLVVAGIFLLKS